MSSQIARPVSAAPAFFNAQRSRRSFGRKQPVELKSLGQVLALANRYAATILVLEHGSKGQIESVPDALKAAEPALRRLDQDHGPGKWLCVFGGDALNKDASDIAHIVHHLHQERGVPVLAVQSEKTKERGGVDRYIDYVHYISTQTKPDGKTLWGGFVDGQAVGLTAVYLGEKFSQGPNAPLKGVLAVGGGPLSLDEVKLAQRRGVSVTYVRTETHFPEATGRYGSVDAWADLEQGKPGSGVTLLK